MTEPWCETTIAWPLDVVDAQVAIVTPRMLTALEWLLLRVIDAHGDAPPALTEVVDRVGLAEVGFLAETVPQLVRLGAVTSRTGDGSFESMAFTDVGRLCFERGQIPGEPKTSGVAFAFDALTDEDYQGPTTASLRSDLPRIAMGLGEPRSSIGLERARERMRVERSPLMAGDSQVKEVVSARGRRAWRQVVVRWAIDEAGRVSANPVGLSEAARDYFASQDWLGAGLVPGVVEAAATLPWRQWRSTTTGLIAQGLVAPRVVATIASARREVVLDAHWMTLAGVAGALDEAAARGVHVLVLGERAAITWPKPSCVRWEVAIDPALRQAVDQPGRAVVVDGGHGLRIDEVVLGVGSRAVVVTVAGELTASAAHAFRGRLLGLVPRVPASAPWHTMEGVPGWREAAAFAHQHTQDVRMSSVLAAFAFGLVDDTAIAGHAQALAGGIDRLALLAALTPRCQQMRGPVPVLETAWAWAWREAARHFDDDACLAAWTRWAPETTLDAYLEHVLQWAVVTPPARAVQRLLVIATHDRWGGVRAHARWRQARDAALTATEDVLVRIEVAHTCLSATELERWAIQALRTELGVGVGDVREVAALHALFAEAKLPEAAWHALIAAALATMAMPGTVEDLRSIVNELGPLLAFKGGRLALEQWERAARGELQITETPAPRAPPRPPKHDTHGGRKR